MSVDALIVALFLMMAAAAAMYHPLEWQLLLLIAAIYLALRSTHSLIRGRR